VNCLSSLSDAVGGAKEYDVGIEFRNWVERAWGVKSEADGKGKAERSRGNALESAADGRSEGGSSLIMNDELENRRMSNTGGDGGSSGSSLPRSEDVDRARGGKLGGVKVNPSAAPPTFSPSPSILSSK